MYILGVTGKISKLLVFLLQSLKIVFMLENNADLDKLPQTVEHHLGLDCF